MTAAAVASRSDAFRSPEKTFGQDWSALADWLADRDMRFDPKACPRQFAGGVGNFNYLIEVDGAPAVLRRPPPGPRPAGANDMAREFQALRALHPHSSVVPKAIALCEDSDVLGVPFLISEFRKGRVIRGAKFDAAPEMRARVAKMLVTELAALHAVPLADIESAQLGAPQGFAVRTAAGWRKRALAATDDAPSDLLVEAADWLAANAPTDTPSPTILHNDFKLDNVIVDPDQPDCPRAVLDWDMATIGDPLFDLATMMSYWACPDDPPAMLLLQQMPSVEPGFLTRREAIDLYGEVTGRDMSAMTFFRALAQFKLAVVLLQLHARWRRDPEKFPEFEPYAFVAEGLLAFTRDLIDERIV